MPRKRKTLIISEIRVKSSDPTISQPGAVELANDGRATALYDEYTESVEYSTLDALADAHGWNYGYAICKYADPIKGERSDLTLEEAREVARGDASLLYLE